MAQVYGLPGVQWQQDGQYFRRDGSVVDADPDREIELRGLRSVIADPAATLEDRENAAERLRAIGGARAAAAAEATREVEQEAQPKGGRPTQAAEEARLRAQLDIYGEPWQSVAAARRFLEGKNA